MSSSPAQAENLYNTPPPDPAGVPCTFRNKSLHQTDLTPNTTAVMTESHNMPHTSVTPTRFYNRILGSHSRQNITQAIPPDADMDHYQSQGQLQQFRNNSFIRTTRQPMSVITNYPNMSHLDMLSTSLNSSDLEDSLEIPYGNKSSQNFINNTEHDLEQIRKLDCCCSVGCLYSFKVKRMHFDYFSYNGLC